MAGPGRAERDMAQARDRGVDGGIVAVDDRLAALDVGLVDELLDPLDCLGRRQHARQMEEAGLHDRVDPAAHARLGGHGEGVDDPEVDLLVDQELLDVGRQVIPDLVGTIRRVEEERRAGLREVEDLDLVEEPELVACDEVGRVDQVGRSRGHGAEAQVRDGGPARLLGVVHEVALGEEVRAFADDLHRGVVRADRAVGAEAEEERLHLSRGARGTVVDIDRQAEMGDVVVDAHREVALGLGRRQLVEDGPDHARGDFLRREAVPAADHARHRRERGRVGVHPLAERGHDGLVERLTDGARLLGPVEDRDRPDGGRERGEERIRRERLEEPDHEHADLLPGGVEGVHRLLHRAGGGAHDHDDAVGIRRAVVVHDAVAAAGLLGELGHHLGHDARHGVVEPVRRLASLEECVRVLRRPADERGVGGHAAGAEGQHVVVADERTDDVLIDEGDLVDLVRGAEPVEEVEERDPRPERGRVRDEREVVGLLDGAGGEHRPAGGPRMHDVAVVAVDREGVRGERPGRDVDDRGRQLARDLEHVRDHEEQALGGREGRAQRALLQRTVERAGRAALGLHLDDIGNLAPQVRLPGRGPVVRVLRHRRGGRDREDRDHLAHRVGDP